MGNVSTYALEFGDPEKVKRLTENCVKNGSDIISPACGLGMKSPLVNVQAILECLCEERMSE
jgi:[methyl-Co(III) methanol-specific corrinoid protein]:coenzyme M methyltransferase